MRSVLEWVLALGVLAGAVWVGGPVVQRLAPSIFAASANSALWNWNMVRAER